MHYGDGQKREQPMTKNISLKDFRVHYNQHSTFQHSTKYIVAQITESYPLPVTVFVNMHVHSLAKSHHNMTRKLRSAFQIANSEATSANLSSFPPCHDLRFKACDPYSQSFRGGMICVICQKSSPFPTPLCAF